MKTILVFGDSNVRGVMPGPRNEKTGLTERYEKNKRWTGLLQNLLGDKYDVIEEGIGGRTTIFEESDPGRPYRNGLSLLPICLETHYPIDLVIFLIGINDTQIQYHATVAMITEGLQQLLGIVKASNKGRSGNAPQILVIAPPIISHVVGLSPQFNDESIDKSNQLPSLYAQLSKAVNCYFLDASAIITTSQIDGIHFDENECVILAHAVANKLQEIF